MEHCLDLQVLMPHRTPADFREFRFKYKDKLSAIRDKAFLHQEQDGAVEGQSATGRLQKKGSASLPATAFPKVVGSARTAGLSRLGGNAAKSKLTASIPLQSAQPAGTLSPVAEEAVTSPKEPIQEKPSLQDWLSGRAAGRPANGSAAGDNGQRQLAELPSSPFLQVSRDELGMQDALDATVSGADHPEPIEEVTVEAFYDAPEEFVPPRPSAMPEQAPGQMGTLPQSTQPPHDAAERLPLPPARAMPDQVPVMQLPQDPRKRPQQATVQPLSEPVDHLLPPHLRPARDKPPDQAPSGERSGLKRKTEGASDQQPPTKHARVPAGKQK